jgi:hypothetical protein
VDSGGPAVKVKTGPVTGEQPGSQPPVPGGLGVPDRLHREPMHGEPPGRGLVQPGGLPWRAAPQLQLAERHGWTDEPATATACLMHGAVLAWQGRLEEADAWVQRAERVLRAEAEPAAVLGVHYTRGVLELGRGGDALAAFQAAERLAGSLAAPQHILLATRALLVYALVRLGETERAEQALAAFGDQDRDRGEMRTTTAALRLAQVTRTPRRPRSPRSWTALHS